MTKTKILNNLGRGKNMGNFFKEEDLKSCEWQYNIKHTDTNNFKCGEEVFLKSNPENPMTVLSINKNDITTLWYDIHDNIQTHKFFPECIIQYEYAGLLVYKQKYSISLN